MGFGNIQMRRSIAAGIVGLVVAVATACSPIARTPRATLDVDGDGRISREEFEGWFGRNGFVRLDTDQSGTITWEEWRAFDATAEARRDFEALDTNHDESISLAEWTYNLGRSGVALRLFTSDLDRDQVLSEDELDHGPVVPVLAITF
jgi:hypothetical protein